MPAQQALKQPQTATTTLAERAATNSDGANEDLTDYDDSEDGDFKPDDDDEDDDTTDESSESDSGNDGDRTRRFDAKEYTKWKAEQEREGHGGGDGEGKVEEKGQDEESDAALGGGDERSGVVVHGEEEEDYGKNDNDNDNDDAIPNHTTPLTKPLPPPTLSNLATSLRQLLKTALYLSTILFYVTGALPSESATLTIMALFAFLIHQLIEARPTPELLRQATLVGLGVCCGAIGCVVLLLAVVGGEE